VARLEPVHDRPADRARAVVGHFDIIKRHFRERS
jgi:hypothetical protein